MGARFLVDIASAIRKYLGAGRLCTLQMQWFGRLLMTKNKFHALFAVVMLLAATATGSSAAEPDWQKEW
jgi:hypothetical protein